MPGGPGEPRQRRHFVKCWSTILFWVSIVHCNSLVTLFFLCKYYQCLAIGPQFWAIEQSAASGRVMSEWNQPYIRRHMSGSMSCSHMGLPSGSGGAPPVGGSNWILFVIRWASQALCQYFGVPTSAEPVRNRHG